MLWVDSNKQTERKEKILRTKKLSKMDVKIKKLMIKKIKREGEKKEMNEE